MKQQKLTLVEIEEFVDNIEGLYIWKNDYCREHHCSMRQFVKDNREALTETINAYLNR